MRHARSRRAVGILAALGAWPVLAQPVASARFSLTVAASRAPKISLTLTDGIAATSGGAGCVNVTTASNFSTTGGAAGTDNLGTYDMAFSTGGPVGAQGCMSPTQVIAISTWNLVAQSNGPGARIDASISAGTTFDSVYFAQSATNDWTTGTTGTALTTTAQTVIASVPSSATTTFPVQLGYGVKYSSSPGAKTTTIQLTMFQP